MLIQDIHFEKPFRHFPAGLTISLRERVTVLVGDNGAGKSTLLSLLRASFKSHKTPSSIHRPSIKGTIRLDPWRSSWEPITYIDLTKDHMGARRDIDSEHVLLHAGIKNKSSGQISILQVTTILQTSKAQTHIIDEPERGLSPAKQHVMAAALKDIIAARPDDQFIICTHSPQIMRALAEEVLVLPDGEYTAREAYLLYSDIRGAEQAEAYLASIAAGRAKLEKTETS